MAVEITVGCKDSHVFTHLLHFWAYVLRKPIAFHMICFHVFRFNAAYYALSMYEGVYTRTWRSVIVTVCVCVYVCVCVCRAIHIHTYTSTAAVLALHRQVPWPTSLATHSSVVCRTGRAGEREVAAQRVCMRTHIST